MQTFLPYPCFHQTAQVLDRSRLGCQRKEARQIIEISLFPEKYAKTAWINHPARLMWKDHLFSLCSYGIAICDEWISRGYKDFQKTKFQSYQSGLENTGDPAWLGDYDFHLSHRSNLLRKGKERFEEKGKRDILDHYRNFWPDTPDNFPYIWPNKVAGNSHISLNPATV